MEIKKRIVIQGEKVHYVGYRPFLLARAMKIGIKRFEAENILENGKQKIVVSLAGDEKQVQEFLEVIRKNYPPQARVSEINEVKEVGRVMDIEDYHKILSVDQQNTIVQADLMMLGKQDQMLEKQDQTVREIRDVKEEARDLRMDMKSYLDQRFEKLEGEIARIKAKMGM